MSLLFKKLSLGSVVLFCSTSFAGGLGDPIEPTPAQTRNPCSCSMTDNQTTVEHTPASEENGYCERNCYSVCTNSKCDKGDYESLPMGYDGKIQTTCYKLCDGSLLSLWTREYIQIH